MARMLLAMALAAGPALAETPVFVTTYCVSCHGAKAQSANRRFDQTTTTAGDVDSLIQLQEILDQLNLGAMPPRAAKQPAAAERTAFVNELTRRVAEGRAKLASTGGETVLRRLNRREYINTVGDLFGIDMLMFDPTTKFPRDRMIAHMDNIGDALVTSGFLLEQYLDAADQVVEKAMRLEPRPEPRTWVFNSNFRQQPEMDYARIAAFGQKYMLLYSVPKSEHEEASYGPLYAFAEGVPVDGYYEIKVQAEAVNRKNPYDPKMLGMDPEAPFRLGVVPGNAKVGALHHMQPIQPVLGEVSLGDSGPEWHTFRVWLDAGYSPRFTFPNGMNNGRLAYQKLLSRYRNLLPEDQRNYTPGIRPARPHLLKYGFMPQIRIHEVRITGPMDAQWPRPSQTLALGGKPFSDARTREILEAFAARAYRRPVAADEVGRLMAVADRRRKEGKSAYEALKDAMKAALCSPAFLYLPENGKTLSPYSLASRLSYFIWSTMPDAELLREAASGALARPEVLRAQSSRMLADPRSRAFVDGLLDSWLNLRSLGDMPPDRGAFDRYYTQDLETAMRTETRMFTRRLLDENLPISNFLDSKFTYLNKPLADLYGLDAGIGGVDGHKFRLVDLKDSRRGGLLGQASVLTVTANGIETSPVTRGVWMLENIFGTPPAPPPDNVPPLDPDVRGAKSMREILTKHRESAACMACHRKIDPPGFALESFDPIGAWRTKYPNGAAIDPSGELTGGQRFEDIAGLKRHLLANREQFTRMLTERLVAYACGRRVEPMDRPRVDRLVRESMARGGGFRDLVESVAASELFREK